MEKEIQTFTKEEQEKIFKLPKRQFALGGKTIEGYYNAETLEMFMVNEKGNLVRAGTAKASAKRPASRSTQEETKKSSANQAEDAKVKKKKVAFLAVVGVVIVGICIGAVALWTGSGGSVSDALKTDTAAVQAEVADSDTQIVSEEEPSASNGVVQVVRTTQDILAGDTLKESMFEVSSLSLYDYNSFVAGSGGIVLWEDMENLLGLKATKYVPALSYLSLDAAAVSADLGANPFTVSEDAVLFTLSVNDVTDAGGHLTIGSVANLEVTREVYDETAGKATPAPEAEDVTIETNVVTEEAAAETEEESPITTGVQVDEAVSRTYTVNIYHLENAVVTDILNASGVSVYSYYAPYLDVPTAKQADLLADMVSDEEFMESVTPAFVVVSISATQAEAVGDTSGDSIELIVSGDLSEDYSELATVSSSLRDVMHTTDVQYTRYLERLEKGLEEEPGEVITVTMDEQEEIEEIPEDAVTAED